MNVNYLRVLSVNLIFLFSTSIALSGIKQYPNLINLPIGQVSEPFKSAFGWHILEVLELRDHDQTKTNKENQARNTIQKRKMDEEIRLWLRRIRDEAYVEFIER